MTDANEVSEDRLIDITPTWSAILPLLAAVLEDGSEAGRSSARAELLRCAWCADRWNAFGGELIAALEHAERAMAATYDDKASSRTALSEALIVVQSALASVYEGDKRR